MHQARNIGSRLLRRRRSIPDGRMIGAVLGLVLALAAPATARAQATLDAHYTAWLAGVPIGKGAWSIEIRSGQYSAKGDGRVIGLMRILSHGEGFASSQGGFSKGHLHPAAYMSSVNSGRRTSEVHMALASGAVTNLVTEPVPPSPDRVPVTEAHRRGVIDPMSAALMPVGGSGDVLSPEACRRTLPIFDGHQRFDLALSFKRMEAARADGYQGPVVVCAVSYRPIAGHNPNRSAVKFLMARQDIEIALAPIPGTRVLAPFRMSVPTQLGAAVLQATRFTTAISASRADPVSADGIQ